MSNREAVLKLLQCNPNQYPQMLEDKFSHILNKIITLWSSPDGAAYLTDLLQPNVRSGGRMDRDGLPEKVWQEIFQVNVLGTFYCCRAAMPLLQKRNGSIS